MGKYNSNYLELSAIRSTTKGRPDKEGKGSAKGSNALAQPSPAPVAAAESFAFPPARFLTMTTVPSDPSAPILVPFVQELLAPDENMVVTVTTTVSNPVPVGETPVEAATKSDHLAPLILNGYDLETGAPKIAPSHLSRSERRRLDKEAKKKKSEPKVEETFIPE